MTERLLTPSAEHLNIDGKTLEKHPKDGKRIFPDGEVFVKVPELEDQDIKVIHSGMPNPNQNQMFLYGILEELKNQGKNVSLLFTYFAYGMQDKKFFPGNLNYAKSVLEITQKHYEVNKIQIIEPHFHNPSWIDEFNYERITIFKEFEKQFGPDKIIIGPDNGTEERFNLRSFKKDRLDSKNVEVEGEINLEGEDVVIFDDLVETGGTMVEAHNKAKELGAESVDAAVIHGVLEKGLERLENTFDKVHVTNTIENSFCNVRLENLISDKL